MSGWGQVTETVLRDWSEGLHTSAEPDQLPPNASPLALNCALRSIGAGTCAVEQRRGIRRITGSRIEPGLIRGQAVLRTQAGAQHHFAFSESGSVVKLLPDGSHVHQNLACTPSTNPVAWAVAHDRLYVCDGLSMNAGGLPGHPGARLDGGSSAQWGITAPAAAPTAVATGSGSMSGSYELALTYANSDTGFESSRSALTTTVVATSQTLSVSWTIPADTQVSHVRVHIRKAALGTNFYQAAEVARSASSTVLNLSDAAYNALITPTPDTDEHNPPPSGIKYCCWHKDRMFVSDGTQVYYSGLGLPESFDPDNVEPVNKSDGQGIVGLFSVNDQLLILKEHSVWTLIGTDPNSWVIQQLDRDTGCVSQRSLVSAEGKTYWWAESGPVAWVGEGAAVPIGTPLIGTTISQETLNYSALALVQAAVDQARERILFAVPELGKSRATMILTWNYRLNRWESLWRLIDVGSFVQLYDTNGVPWVYLGGYNGHVYRLWDADTDGADTTAGTTSGTFVAATSTLSSIAAVGIATTQAEAQDLYVTVETLDGTTSWRRRVVGATPTTLALESSIGPLAIGDTYRWFLGAIDWQFETAWIDDGRPWTRKRYEFAYLHGRASQQAVPIHVDIYVDWQSTPSRTRTLAFAGGAQWDVGEWDVSRWGESSALFGRIRVAKTGKVWKLKVRSRNVLSSRALLYKVAMRGELLTDKR